MIDAKRIAWLKDKLQSWPKTMAFTSEDAADLVALLNEKADEQAEPETPERTSGPRERLRQIHSALDVALGDTDPSFPEDITDDEIRDQDPLFWATKELAGLIESSPNGDKSSGERPCATVPKLSITHGDDGYWLCIDSPSGKHAGIHIEKRPEMTIVNAVLAEVAIELAGGEQAEPEKPAPPAKPFPDAESLETLKETGVYFAPLTPGEEALTPKGKKLCKDLDRIIDILEEPDAAFPAAKVETAFDYLMLPHQPAPTTEERREMVVWLDAIVGDYYETLEMGESQKRHYDRIRALILSPPEPVKVTREWVIKFIRSRFFNQCEMLREKGIVVEEEVR